MRKNMTEHSYSQYYNVVNDMRKLLEFYLFYKYPNTDFLIDHLDKLFEDHIPSQVNQVVNKYSHLAWAERGLRVIDVPEMETTAKHLLLVLKNKDFAQYETLCDNIGVDKGVDLGQTA